MDGQPIAVRPVGPIPTRSSDAVLLRLAGWSAALGVVMVIASGITISLFFAVGQPWGTVNDALTALLALTFLPPIAAFRLLERRASAGQAAVGVAIIGTVGAAAAAIIAAGVALGIVAFEATYGLALLAFGITGAWLVLVGIVRNGGVVSRVTSGAGILAGIGYILVVVASWVAGTESGAVTAIGAIAVIGQIVWGIGVGRGFVRVQGAA
jgi:hypothetical protein